MIAEALGWIGTFGTIGAYVLLSRGHWHATSIRYAALNGVGGVLGAAGSSLYGAWPSVASNVIWAAVAAQSIVMTYRERHAARPAPVSELNLEPGAPTGELAVLDHEHRADGHGGATRDVAALEVVGGEAQRAPARVHDRRAHARDAGDDGEVGRPVGERRVRQRADGED